MDIFVRMGFMYHTGIPCGHLCPDKNSLNNGYFCSILINQVGIYGMYVRYNFHESFEHKQGCGKVGIVRGTCGHFCPVPFFAEKKMNFRVIYWNLFCAVHRSPISFKSKE